MPNAEAQGIGNSGISGGGGSYKGRATGSNMQGLRNTRYEDRSTGPKKKKVPATLLWKFKGEQTHFVEGHEKELRYGGDPNISGGENKRRNAAYTAQQDKWSKEFATRQKIKPITDPDANKSENRKRA